MRRMAEHCPRLDFVRTVISFQAYRPVLRLADDASFAAARRFFADCKRAGANSSASSTRRAKPATAMRKYFAAFFISALHPIPCIQQSPRREAASAPSSRESHPWLMNLKSETDGERHILYACEYNAKASCSSYKATAIVCRA